MLTAKAAFVLSNSFSLREVLERIDKNIRADAKHGDFHTKYSIEGAYTIAAVKSQLERAGYQVNEYPDSRVTGKCWLRILWGQAL